jgi:hypothetical protein
VLSTKRALLVLTPLLVLSVVFKTFGADDGKINTFGADDGKINKNWQY